MTDLVPPTPVVTTTQGARFFRLPIALAVLGAISSLITTAWNIESRWSAFEGVVFGVAMVCGLVAFKALKNPVKAAGLIFLSPVAFYAAHFASFVTQLVLSGLGLLTPSERWTMGNGGSPSPIALFIGGLMGGFLLVGAVLWLLAPRGHRVRKAVLWSAASGLFAIVGWALSPLLGPGLSHVLRIMRPKDVWLTAPAQSSTPDGPLGIICSVFFVWQTGMAFVIGLIARARNLVSSQENPQ